MKIFFVFVFAFVAHASFAQDNVYEGVKTALKAGDADALTMYFNKTVDISFQGEAAPYSKANAERMMQNFFKKFPPAEFNFVHKGASKGGLHFGIGKYQSGTTTFSVLMRMNKVGAEYLIHEMTFTQE